ncbi:MAG: cyclophilin-like fold protein [Nitrosopumilus sp.]
MKHTIKVDIPKFKNIDLELDDTMCPKTVKSFLQNLPFTLGVNLWGEEIYTNESPINVDEENAKDLVELYDVAYWPTGKAICLFYGPTPIGNKNEIKPYSPVNVIGKILKPDKHILSELKNGTNVTFKKK